MPSAQAIPEAPPSGVGIVAMHAAALRIDLLDAILGDLEQVLAVEGGARMRARH